MRTDLYRFAPELDDVVDDGDLIGYHKPQTIVEDPTLSVGRKRQLLAHWASDVHAVGGAPALRSVRGTTVSIDDIMDALTALDALGPVSSAPSLAASLGA